MGWEMSEPKFDQINMVPFIDIVLVLLAIVMTTASFVSQGLIDVALPESESATPSQQQMQKSVEIAIDDENVIFYDGKAVSLSELRAKLATASKDMGFYLRIDKGADFESFINVFDALKVLGLDNISIQTEVD